MSNKSIIEKLTLDIQILKESRIGLLNTIQDGQQNLEMAERVASHLLQVVGGKMTINQSDLMALTVQADLNPGAVPGEIIFTLVPRSQLPITTPGGVHEVPGPVEALSITATNPDYVAEIPGKEEA